MEQPTNHSCLGVAPLERVLPIVGVVLVGLLVAVRPEASAGLNFVDRVSFWTLHVFAGLAGIWLAGRWLERLPTPRLPLAVAIALAGLGGVLIVAPVYVALEWAYPVPSSEVPDGWLDRFAEGGPPHAVLAEALEVAPGFLFAWLAVNLPLLFGKPVVTPFSGGKPRTSTTCTCTPGRGRRCYSAA